MYRIPAVFLLLVVPALAQGVDAWIDEALDPTTDTAKRGQRFEQIARAGKDAMDKLALRGLAVDRSPEVVHGVVSTLFANDAYADHLEAICALVADTNHRETMLARVQDVGEDPARSEKLLEGILSIARDPGNEIELRRAAVLALGAVPRRRALTSVVTIGLADERLAKTCLDLVRWLGVQTLPQAAQWLSATPAHKTYYDIMLARLRAVDREIEELRKFERIALQKAGPKEAFEALASSDLERRRIGAARLQAIAESDKVPAAFGTQMFDAFVGLRAPKEVQDARTFEHLCDTLAALAVGDEAPLFKERQKADLIAALRAVIGDDRFTTSDDRKRVGSAVVRLLRAIGRADVLYPLAAFAKDFRHTAVRAQAIQELGDLGRRLEAARPAIGGELAKILASESDPAIRRQVLTTLTQRTVPVMGTLPTIQAFLTPADGATPPKLAASEVRDCIIILEQDGSDDAFELLKKLATERADLRRLVVEKGLLPLARRNGKEPAILAFLKALVLGDGVKPDEQAALIATLGKEGTRNADAALSELGATEQLAPEVRAAVTAARGALALRLAGSAVREDLAVALRVLVQFAKANKPAWPQVEELARTIVRTGDGAKIPVGEARHRVAQAFRAKTPAPPRDAVIELYETAASRAKDDGLTDPQQAALLKEYCDVLLAGEPREQDYAGAMKWCAALGDLASEGKPAQADHLMKAAECAIAVAKAPEAERFLAEAAKRTALEGERKARHEKLTAAAAALKAG